MDSTDSEKLNTLILTNPISTVAVNCQWDDADVWIPMGWYCNVIAVHPDADSLRAAIDQALVNLRESGELDALLDRWL